MLKLPETDVREMLERRASSFVMPPAPTNEVLARAGRRKARNALLASAATLVVAGLVALSVLPLGVDQAVDRAGGAAGSAGGPPPAPTSGGLQLVDYVVRTPARDHPHSATGPKITVDDVRDHGACMRSHGFDVPEPTTQPGGGWAVTVDHPKAHGLTFGSRRFRQAWFVTCGPLGGPLSGDLVIGGPRGKIDRFMGCMRRQGFHLPEPTKDSSGSNDIDEWQFDLTDTTIDTSTRAWNRAMFVVCAPDHI
jgi:hypothetical protein